MPDEPRINPYRMIYVETAAEYLAQDFIPRYMAWFYGTEEAKRIPTDYGPIDIAKLAADWDEKHRPSAVK